MGSIDNRRGAEVFDRMKQRRQEKVKINRSKRATPTRRHLQHNEDKHTADQIIQFEHVGLDHPEVLRGERAPDDAIVTLLKQEINDAGISRRDLYGFIGEGEGKLFVNENQAYNLEYGLRKRATITMDSVHKWMSIIGKEFMMITQTVDNGWFNAVMEIRDRLLSDEPVTVEELRELAERTAED